MYRENEASGGPLSGIRFSALAGRVAFTSERRSQTEETRQPEPDETRRDARGR